MLIGIILSVAVFSTDGGREAQVEREARRLQALLALAGEEAVLTRHLLAARIRPDGYRFEIRTDDSWQPLQGVAALRQHRFPDGMTVRLLQNDLPVALDDSGNPARILFLPTGETTPFVMQLGWALEDFTLQLTGGESGELRLEWATEGI